MKKVLFGAGKIGRRVIEKNTYDIVAVIDNDSNKWGSSLLGKPIISLNEYKRLYKQFDIIIATLYVDSIERQLRNNGVWNYEVAVEIFEDLDVKTDADIAHGKWIDYLVNNFDKTGYRIMEIGSRNVTQYRDRFKNAAYVGFDYYAGVNVDVVGDAHKLSTYFSDKFDLIFSSACFEHLAMPWQVSIEIIKSLKVGGYVFIETHYSFSSHGRPWHFFQYSDNALDVLFPPKFGMKCEKKGCSNLIEGRFSSEASDYLVGRMVNGLYCHSEYLGRKIEDVDSSELDWSKIDFNDVRHGTEYPGAC